jgi:hypothetical protein
MAPAAFFTYAVAKHFLLAKFLQYRLTFLDTGSVEQNIPIANESVARAAGRILFAWRSGKNLGRELENARRMANEARVSSTLEMEVLEVLSGAVESLTRQGGQQAGAVRLLEHLATNSRMA